MTRGEIPSVLTTQFHGMSSYRELWLYYGYSKAVFYIKLSIINCKLQIGVLSRSLADISRNWMR
jgi:hypothetical protein